MPTAVRAAPSTVVLSGQTVAIDAYLWRDFMPMTAPNGQALIASVSVRDASGGTLNGAIVGDSLWVIAPNDVWVSTAAEQSRGTVLQLVARNGPLLDPGTHVDVVLRLRDQAGHTSYVRASDRVIARTD